MNRVSFQRSVFSVGCPAPSWNSTQASMLISVAGPDPRILPLRVVGSSWDIVALFWLSTAVFGRLWFWSKTQPGCEALLFHSYVTLLWFLNLSEPLFHHLQSQKHHVSESLVHTRVFALPVSVPPCGRTEAAGLTPLSSQETWSWLFQLEPRV